jgi:hypothetical protein
MKELIRKMVPDSMMDFYRQFRQQQYDRSYFPIWNKNGRSSAAPYYVKQNTIKEFAAKYKSKYFIETGTLYGDMVSHAASLGIFERVYSIELSDFYFNRAKNRFRKNLVVDLRHGDSGQVLPKLLEEINDAVIFWLDGHYSGSNTATLEDVETPVSQELVSVLEHGKRRGIGHVILLDDARCFDGTKGYPVLSKLKEEIELTYLGYLVEVKDDIIRIFRG